MRIFICGDSTAASYSPEDTRMVGWGQLLEGKIKGIRVVNLAMAGRSTRSFLAENRLAPIAEQARPGDLALIQFAHNDEDKRPERHTEPWTEFRENLAFFVRFARRYQVRPVLMTPICIRLWKDGLLQPTHGDYTAALRSVAEEMNVPLIDLYAESCRIVTMLGEQKSKTLFMNLIPGEDSRYPGGLEDNAHTQYAGAEQFASFVARQLKVLGLIPCASE